MDTTTISSSSSSSYVPITYPVCSFFQCGVGDLFCLGQLNITAPNEKQMKRIFGSILSAKLADFENEVRLMGDNLMLVCIGVYTEVVKELLPTPSKSHYVFNMRDLAKVPCKPPRVALCYSSLTLKVKLDMFFKNLDLLVASILCVDPSILFMGDV